MCLNWTTGLWCVPTDSEDKGDDDVGRLRNVIILGWRVMAWCRPQLSGA